MHRPYQMCLPLDKSSQAMLSGITSAHRRGSQKESVKSLVTSPGVPISGHACCYAGSVNGTAAVRYFAVKLQPLSTASATTP